MSKEIHNFTPNPKPKFRKRNKKVVITPEDREHLERIKSMGCITCPEPPPSNAHHITKCGKRISHKHTLPLCTRCHVGIETGDISVHGSKKTFEAAYGTQMELLEKVNEMLEWL